LRRFAAGGLVPLLALSVFRLLSFGIRDLLPRRFVSFGDELSYLVSPLGAHKTQNGVFRST
jgi:hypothetical protein